MNRRQPTRQMSNLLGSVGKTRTARATCTAAFGRPGSLIRNNCDHNCDQPGYLGGRWWIDVNGNDIQDAGDNYLLCPLLGPGRTSP